MPRLSDFDPAWIDDPATGRTGIGVSFRCVMGHCSGRMWCLFSNPLDGGNAHEGDCFSLMFEHYERTNDGQRQGPIHDRGCGQVRWQRSGETFETLSLTPSVDAHQCGHFVLKEGGW